MRDVLFAIALFLISSSVNAAGVDQAMEEMLKRPGYITLAAVCQKQEATRGVRFLEVSGWGSGATELIETNKGILFIQRVFTLAEKQHGPRTIVLPPGTKDVAALLSAFAGHTKQDLLRDLPPAGRPVIDGGSMRITTFIRNGGGYEIDIPNGQELGDTKRSLPAALVGRLFDLQQHYFPQKQ